jgi:hypothetical protein
VPDSEQESGTLDYGSLDSAQQSRYSAVVQAGLPVDENLPYIMEGVVWGATGDSEDNET